MVDKALITRNFSKHAHSYERYSSIQKRVAQALAAFSNRGRFSSILDIGCGTGIYTRLLREMFPDSNITAVDISSEMILVAKEKTQSKNIKFLVSDAESALPKGEFDLITSNACFQWFEDIESALVMYKSKLNAGGAILFSIFGPQTLCELGRSINKMGLADSSISAGDFKSRDCITAIMNNAFKEVETESHMLKHEYKSISELLKSIKYTGTAGDSAGIKKLWTPSMVEELENVYREDFNGIEATYEALFFKGIR